VKTSEPEVKTEEEAKYEAKHGDEVPVSSHALPTRSSQTLLFRCAEKGWTELAEVNDYRSERPTVSRPSWTLARTSTTATTAETPASGYQRR
jgi:hypothetical protein